ncbi:MAG: hypothetical protein Q8L77_08745 [Nitrospirota bacterium]|nr:hypothetical protein [Nitrospirota bacterium]
MSDTLLPLNPDDLSITTGDLFPAPYLHLPNHTPSAISHTLDENRGILSFLLSLVVGPGGSGGHRRRGTTPRIRKQKLTGSAREFPKAFRLAEP